MVTTGSGVSSELVIRVHVSDNGVHYRCEATNSALKKPLTAFVRVTVKCKTKLYLNIVNVHPV